ncbi:MAG: methyltransferase domain-containing protein [Proteobacteria bacterium]|nr:methyltransferase domain-containing protein [Pseudomonadota bacterium]MCP4918485.1 methyltransferase domain-containing protein [Pseudomonadota bacterium]
MPAIPRSKRDLDRLALQARACFDREAQALAAIGFPREGRALDVGCAAGHFGSLLKQRYPHIQVHGVNFDSDRTYADLDELTGRHLDSYARVASLPKDAFDAVYTRFFLRHVPTPEGLVAEMRDACMPGGIVAAIETDDGALRTFPELPGLTRTLKAVHANHSEVDPFVGLRLRDLMIQARLTDVRVVPVVLSSEDIGKDVFLQLLSPFLDAGRNALGDGELRRVTSEIAAWRRHPGAFASWTLYCGGGRVSRHA